MKNSGIKSGFSIEKDTKAAAKEVAEQIKQDNIELVVFFAAVDYDFAKIAKTLYKTLGRSPMIGCTTAGEITPSGFMNNSLTAMSISSDKISKVKVGVIKDLQKNAGKAGSVLQELAQSMDIDLKKIDPNKHVGIILPDGLSLKEEAVMDSLANTSMDLIAVGGSSGDSLKFERTLIAVNDQVYENATAMALLEMKAPFEIIKKTSYAPTPIIFEITKADEEKRIVYEFSGKPAADEYARVIGVEPDELNETVFMSNPLGLVIGDDPYVRSPAKVFPDKSIQFYSNISEGAIVNLMESTDPVIDTQNIIKDVKKKLGHVSGLIIFNCILRYLECESREVSKQVFEAFGDSEKIGFNTYGEQYYGHINQTVTILCIQ
jgi:hypothetical protein